MSAVSCRVKIIVDPCGRWIVWEQEHVPAGTSCDSPQWHRSPACRTYEFEVQVPVPELLKPTVADLTVRDGESVAESWLRQTPKEL